MLSWLKTRRTERHQAAELYGAVVTQARSAAFFAQAGVPDTPEGRCEMIVLHLFLALERLRAAGPAAETLTREVIEAYVIDVDDQLREMGVGDLSVPKKVRRAAALFYERSEALRAALAEAAGNVALEEVLANVTADSAGAGRLAGYVRAAAAHMDGLELAELSAGRVSFPKPL
jgi:cytochrome b pre-mRNA-processing protein 3